MICGSPAMPTRDELGRRLALIVASSDYRDPTLRQLRAPGHDASDLAEVLSDPAIGMFDVRTFMDAPSDQLLRGIAQFCRQAGPGDLLLVYLSCHGVLDDRGRLYYATANTEHSLLSATAVSAQWLSEQLDDCRARQKILVLDCCHSGAFAKGSKGDTALALKDRFSGRGKIVLTASGATEYSFEDANVVGEGVRSVFTRAVVDGLRTGEADRDKDGLVTANDLYHHVYDTVRAAEPRQTPKLWVFGAEGDLLVAHSPRGPIVEPAALPEDLRLTLENPRLVIRESGVKVLAELLDHAEPGLALTARQTLQRIREEDHPRIAALARAAHDADHGDAVTQLEAQEHARREAERAAGHRRQMKQLQQQIRGRAAAQDWDAVVAANGKLAACDPAAADPDSLASIAREQITRRQQAKSTPMEAGDQLTEFGEWPWEAAGKQDLTPAGRARTGPVVGPGPAPGGVDHPAASRVGDDHRPPLADAPGPDPGEEPAPATVFRRGGHAIPRRFVVIIALAVLTAVIIGGGALYFTQQEYYVGTDSNQVTIFRGINQRVAGIDLSSVYAHTGITEQQIPPQELQMVQGTISATSLDDAHHIVGQLRTQDSQCKLAYTVRNSWTSREEQLAALDKTNPKAAKPSSLGPQPTVPSDCSPAAALGVAPVPSGAAPSSGS